MSSAVLPIGLLMMTVATDAPKTAARSAVVSPPPVVLIGADGMTFDVLNPLLEAGELPNISALINRGASAVLNSEDPMRSPAIWTTLATGQPRSVHKIYDFVTGTTYWPKELRTPDQHLVTSDMRGAPALWQLASAQRKKSLVVGWLNTWPAEKLHGIMFAPYVALNELRQTSIKGRIYRRAEGQAYPAEQFARILPLIVPTEEVGEQHIKPLADVPAKGSLLYQRIPILERYMFSLRWSIASTLTNVRLLESSVANHGPFDLYMTYFDGSDTLAHRFWIMRSTEKKIRERLAAHGFDPELAAELKRRFGGVVDGYYRLIDKMIGRIRRAVGHNATIVLVSDHGWGDSEGPAALHSNVPFDGVHFKEGVFIAAGEQIRPGKVSPLSLYEVAPTVLYLMGVQPPAAMPGRIATEIIRPEQLRRHKPTASNAPVPRAEKATQRPAPHADEEMQRLRSLGYID